MSSSWIKKLQESDSRLHKEDVIKQAYEAATLGNEISARFLRGLYQCYNSYITYGIKQIPDSFGISGAENPWSDFEQLLDDLEKRKLTGHAARDAVQEMSERFDSDEWNDFLAPILRRDMRVGISDKTINKIVKGSTYEIPKFGCQLATDCEGRPEMKGKKRLEPKLDGVRSLMFVRMSDFGDTIVTYSRNGKIFYNFHHIEKQIMEVIEKLTLLNPTILFDGFVLDGEMVGESFQELMRQAQRKTNVQNEDSVFHIFDIIPMKEFKAGYWEADLKTRLALLDKMAPTFAGMKNVELLSHIIVDLDTEQGKKEFEEYAQLMVDLGYEGIMIKDLDAPYECDRSVYWMKWKPTITLDLMAIKLEEGTGRNKGRLGAIVCHGIDQDREIEVNVGSGYTDEERDEFWKHQDSILGRTVEVQADAVTKNKNGTYSMRFPRFLRFRDDK